MGNSENTQRMRLSQPDPALKRLEKLVGTWELKGRTPKLDGGQYHGLDGF